MKMTQSSSLKRLSELDNQIKLSNTTRNILHNTGHSAIYFPINQRGFDGDWEALEIGEYGFDGWLKYSDTHKAQIIELGDFEDIDYTLSYNGGEIATISPPSGGNSHWLVAVPFDADKIDLRPAYGKGLWQSENYDSKLNKSLRYYFYINGSITYGLVYSENTWFSICTYRVEMRIAPALSSDANNLIKPLSFYSNKYRAQMYQTVASGYSWLKADASFKVSDAEENITIIGGEHEL